MDRLEQRLGQCRLHDVEFELAGLGGERHRDVVAEDLEADLVDDLGDHRIHLRRHDRGSSLHLGKIDLFEPCSRPGRQQTKVVADLRQFGGSSLDGGVHGDVGTVVRRGLDEVIGRFDLVASHLGELAACRGRVTFRGVDTGADGSTTKVDLEQQLTGDGDALDLMTQSRRIGDELISQAHRYGVLELGTAHLEHVGELLALGLEGCSKVLNGLGKLLEQRKDCQPETSRVGVIRRL